MRAASVTRFVKTTSSRDGFELEKALTGQSFEVVHDIKSINACDFQAVGDQHRQVESANIVAHDQSFLTKLDKFGELVFSIENKLINL